MNQHQTLKLCWIKILNRRYDYIFVSEMRV